MPTSSSIVCCGVSLSSGAICASCRRLNLFALATCPTRPHACAPRMTGSLISSMLCSRCCHLRCSGIQCVVLCCVVLCLFHAARRSAASLRRMTTKGTKVPMLWHAALHLPQKTGVPLLFRPLWARGIYSHSCGILVLFRF